MASNYPVALDAISKIAVDNPDSVDALNQMQTIGKRHYTQQAIAFGATITPDYTLGQFITVGQLTGPLTVANPAVNPPTPGTKMTFLFQQDGTGSRVVSWGNLFRVPAASLSATASKFSTIEVTWDGSNWNQTGGAAAIA